jgi:hypothetical protein
MKIINEKNRVQWIIAGIASVLIAFAVYSYQLYQWGVSSAETAAAVQYSEAEQVFTKRQTALENDKQAANKRADDAIISSLKTKKENDLLRQAAEINRQLLRDSDDRRRLESAARLNLIVEEKKSEIQKIQSDTDFNSNVCALCSEFNNGSGGLRLSDEFCARCAKK